MGLIATLKRWFNMIFKKQAEEDFNIQAAEFPEMEALINRLSLIHI